MDIISKAELNNLRQKAKEKFSKASKMLFLSKEQIEQATPEIVASYRAKRLSKLIKNKIVVDACCGIAIDAIFLAKHCKKLYAIDISKDALIAAEHNAKIYGVKNIEFINDDCFNVSFSSLNADFVFADPSRRLPNNRRVKDFSKTLPSTSLLIRKCIKENIEAFAIEVSRDFFVEELPKQPEKQYISVQNELNCVTLYYGKAKQCNVSAVVLPKEHYICCNSYEHPIPKPLQEPLLYLYELNDCISKSRLYIDLLETLNNKAKIFTRNLLTSNELLKSPFFKASYKILEVIPKRPLAIISKLNAYDAKKAILHGTFQSMKEHKKLTEKINSMLVGNEKILHVFLLKEKAIIAESI